MLLLNNTSTCVFLGQNPELKIPINFSMDKLMRGVDYKTVLRDSQRQDALLCSGFVVDFMFVKTYYQAVQLQLVKKYSVCQSQIVELVRDAVDISKATDFKLDEIELVRSGNLL